MANENETQVAEVKEKPVLTIGQIKQDLKDGLDRFTDKENPDAPSIQSKYGLRRVDVMRIFQNEELKGLKVHRPRPASSKSKATIGFILKDDNGNDVTPTTASAPKGATSGTTDGSAVGTENTESAGEVAEPASQEAAW